ncbi:MAG: hypothetical protein A2297_09900 [Elusimicrobia bacterium RIFOXYB2_FULL_48_7]|nr:MAG: hypothetical protein A2297_09900 [Elusimicrobia bacterium RIFOXYB2_FULL_48_7]
MEPQKSVLDGKKFSKYFLLAAFILSLVFFLSMIKVFFLPIIFAVIIAMLVYPLYRFILKFIKKRGLASLVCCLLLLIMFFLPLFFISRALISQSMGLYYSAEPQVNNLMQKDNFEIIEKFMQTPVGAWLIEHNITIDWRAILGKTLGFLESTTASFVNNTFKTTVNVVFNIFIAVFSLFYFLKDGETLILQIKDIIPLTEEYKDRIISRFYTMSNATVKGILFIAFIQSSLATLVLWIFGIKAWLLWGLIMLVLAVIPFAGTGIVLVPTGIIKIVNGDILQGLIIILISVFFISFIDNVLRPRIVGKHAGMHDLLVFFSMIGGIFTFGPTGFIIGPLIASVFLSILEIYKIEFRKQINPPEPDA